MKRLVLLTIVVALMVIGVRRHADSAAQLMDEIKKRIDEATAQLRGRPSERTSRYDQAEKVAQ